MRKTGALYLSRPPTQYLSLHSDAKC